MNDSIDHREGSPTSNLDQSSREENDAEPAAGCGSTNGGKMIQTPCEQCSEAFSFDKTLHLVIRKAVHFHYLAEEYEVVSWQEYSGQHGSSDYQGMRCLKSLALICRGAAGLYKLETSQIMALRGSMHIAMAAGILDQDEQRTGSGLLNSLMRFRWHVSRDHRDGDAVSVDVDAIEDLEKPLYLGEIDPEWGWRWAPEFAGKSLDDIAAHFEQLLDERLEEFRANVATVHDGNPEHKSVSQAEVADALTTIEQLADDWHEQVRVAEHCCQLLNLSCEVHELTSKLDAWVGTDSAGDQYASDRDRIYLALEQIPSLVDWEACQNLKRLRDAFQSSSHTPELALEPTTMVTAGGKHHD